MYIYIYSGLFNDTVPNDISHRIKNDIKCWCRLGSYLGVSGSNPNPKIIYPDRGFSGFIQSVQKNAGMAP